MDSETKFLVSPLNHENTYTNVFSQLNSSPGLHARAPRVRYYFLASATLEVIFFNKTKSKEICFFFVHTFLKEHLEVSDHAKNLSIG